MITFNGKTVHFHSQFPGAFKKEWFVLFIVHRRQEYATSSLHRVLIAVLSLNPAINFKAMNSFQLFTQKKKHLRIGERLIVAMRDVDKTVSGRCKVYAMLQVDLALLPKCNQFVRLFVIMIKHAEVINADTVEFEVIHFIRRQKVLVFHENVVNIFVPTKENRIAHCSYSRRNS